MMCTGNRLAALAIALASIVVVVGCSDSDDDTAAPTTTGAAATASPTTPGSVGGGTPTTDGGPPVGPTATGDATFCDTARALATDVGDDALEVDELRHRPERFAAFREGVVALDGYLRQMSRLAPETIADDLGAVAGAVHTFAVDAKNATSADELIAAAPDFDTGTVGRAADALEDFVEARCRVDLDLD